MTNRYAALPESPGSANGGEAEDKIWARNLQAFYVTDPELVAAVLPRPLEFTEPHVRINFAQVDMPTGPLGGCTVSVKCRHDGVDGTYDLLMVMTVEGAVVGGRETFGEPKKVGEAAIECEGDRVDAVMSRKGIDIVQIHGRVAAEVDPLPLNERHAFYFKFMLDPSGGGFDSEPLLVDVCRTQEDRLRREIAGEIVLTDSPFDPVADLPVREVLSIVYTESHQTQTGEIVGPVPPEWIWPFRHQRYDGLMLSQGSPS